MVQKHVLAILIIAAATGCDSTRSTTTTVRVRCPQAAAPVEFALTRSLAQTADAAVVSGVALATARDAETPKPWSFELEQKAAGPVRIALRSPDGKRGHLIRWDGVRALEVVMDAAEGLQKHWQVNVPQRVLEGDESRSLGLAELEHLDRIAPLHRLTTTLTREAAPDDTRLAAVLRLADGLILSDDARTTSVELGLSSCEETLHLTHSSPQPSHAEQQAGTSIVPPLPPPTTCTGTGTSPNQSPAVTCSMNNTTGMLYNGVDLTGVGRSQLFRVEPHNWPTCSDENTVNYYCGDVNGAISAGVAVDVRGTGMWKRGRQPMAMTNANRTLTNNPACRVLRAASQGVDDGHAYYIQGGASAYPDGGDWTVFSGRDIATVPPCTIEWDFPEQAAKLYIKINPTDLNDFRVATPERNVNSRNFQTDGPSDSAASPNGVAASAFISGEIDFCQDYDCGRDDYAYYAVYLTYAHVAACGDHIIYPAWPGYFNFDQTAPEPPVWPTQPQPVTD